ncbi:MAG: transposase [Patescibacteria group bacterium]
MGRALREFYKGGFWHVVNRGVMKDNVFRSKDDYSFFLYRIKESLKKYPVDIHSFNLLPNHIHYLLGQSSDDNPSKFLASVHTSLSLFINRKYDRVGHLFQNRCTVKDIKDDEHLLNVSFYVNLNKVLEKLQGFDRSKTVKEEDLEKLLTEAENDPWSSYPVILGLRNDGITNPDFLLSLFSNDKEKARQEYRKMAKEFIKSGHFLKTRDLNFEKV